MSVGRNAADANARRLAKEAELNAINHGVALVPQNGNGDRVALAAAIQDFLEEKSLQRKKKTHVDYETALRYFQQSCPKQYLEDITRKGLLGFAVFCRKELELSPRTVFNKFARVGWKHELLVENILAPLEGVFYPVCLAGARACPPEDVGGMAGYEDFLAAINDPRHPEHQESMAWGQF